LDGPAAAAAAVDIREVNEKAKGGREEEAMPAVGRRTMKLTAAV
jgi:hypothetical protein